MKRITCRELGEKLGLSHSTVARALRNHPSLPAKTRERVQQLANELGYRPDPALAALNTYRQANREVTYHATLAWIQTYPRPVAVPPNTTLHQYFMGAQQRAEKLGYKLEEFFVPPPTDWKRLIRTLRSRRIEGVLIPPSEHAWDSIGENDFPWQDFHAVALARTAIPGLHLVINNQFQSAVRVVFELHALGYRRIGIVMPEEFAHLTEYHFLGGYLAECSRLGLKPLQLPDASTTPEQKTKHTVAWLRKHKPEAVIASGDGDILPALAEAGLRIPHDIAVAYLSRSPLHPEIAGIYQNNLHIGEAGANQLIDLIRRNERGIPPFPVRLLIEGTWVSAPSSPPKRVAGTSDTCY